MNKLIRVATKIIHTGMFIFFLPPTVLTENKNANENETNLSNQWKQTFIFLSERKWKQTLVASYLSFHLTNTDM